MFNHLTLALVSVPVLTFAWAFGGMRGDVLRLVMPYATVCGLLGLLLPQRRPNEGWGAAYGRALGGMLRDPLLYIVLLFAAYLIIALFNVADPTTLRPPHGPWRPFCVVKQEHAGMLYWFVPSLLTALGVRHALTRTGKRAFFEVLVWDAAALSLLGFAQIIGGAQFPYWTEMPHAPHFFSTFGYPNMGGSFFTLSYALSLGLWAFRMSEVEDIPLVPQEGEKKITHTFIHAHYPIIAVALNLSAILATFSRAAMVLSLLLTAVFALYIVARMFGTTGTERVRRFRSALTAGIALLAFVATVWVYAPPEIGRELKTLNLFSLSDRVSGKGQYHTSIASAIMRDYPLFGVGGWGYCHFSPVYLAYRGKDIYPECHINTSKRHSMTKPGELNRSDWLCLFMAAFILVRLACIWKPSFMPPDIWEDVAVSSGLRAPEAAFPLLWHALTTPVFTCILKPKFQTAV